MTPDTPSQPPGGLARSGRSVLRPQGRHPAAAAVSGHRTRGALGAGRSRRPADHRSAAWPGRVGGALPAADAGGDAGPHGAGLARRGGLRRMLGVGTACYAGAHLLLYCVDQKWQLGTVASEIAQRFYLAIGFAALLMLGVLAVTSTDGWQKRLGRRWKRLHRLVFVLLPLVLLALFPAIQGRCQRCGVRHRAGVLAGAMASGAEALAGTGAAAAAVGATRRPGNRRHRGGLVRPGDRRARRTGAGSQSRHRLRPPPGSGGGAVRAGAVRGRPAARGNG